MGIKKVRKNSIAEWTSHRDCYFRAYLNVTNTNQEIIEWLRDSFGGSVAVKRPANEKHKAVYQWTIAFNKKVKPFLMTVRPYLRIKRKQADILMRFIGTFDGRHVERTGKSFIIKDDTHNERERLWKENSYLNSKGTRTVQVERLSEVTAKADAIV